MREIKTIRRTENVTKVTCDLCGAGGAHVCCLCGRDVCHGKCVVYDPRDSGDYPSKYCKDCWALGQPYITEIERIELESDAAIEAVNARWLAAAKEHVATIRKSGEQAP